MAPSPNQAPPSVMPATGAVAAPLMLPDSQAGSYTQRWTTPATAIEVHPNAKNVGVHSPALQAIRSKTALKLSPATAPASAIHRGGWPGSLEGTSIVARLNRPAKASGGSQTRIMK